MKRASIFVYVSYMFLYYYDSMFIRPLIWFIYVSIWFIYVSIWFIYVSILYGLYMCSHFAHRGLDSLMAVGGGKFHQRRQCVLVEEPETGLTVCALRGAISEQCTD